MKWDLDHPITSLSILAIKDLVWFTWPSLNQDPVQFGLRYSKMDIIEHPRNGALINFEPTVANSKLPFQQILPQETISLEEN